MTNTNQARLSEKGNVLFLILIAVALFAALSYVVTQSTRSGGGSTEREKNILSSAQMTQYPTSLRTAIIRMVLGGVAIENIKFNTPGAFGAISVPQLVFHPQGGGAGHQDAPADLSASGNSNLPWSYNGNFYVPGVGMDTAGGNDIIAFLPGISAGICRQVNEELGVPAVAPCTLTGGAPTIDASTATATLIRESLVDAVALPAGPGVVLQGTGSGCAAFTRQASGCFAHASIVTPGNTPGYVFYSILLER